MPGLRLLLAKKREITTPTFILGFEKFSLSIIHFLRKKLTTYDWRWFHITTILNPAVERESQIWKEQKLITVSQRLYFLPKSIIRNTLKANRH
jgi:hypothetical protein